MRPHKPGLFSYLHPATPDTGCFPPRAKNSKRNESNQRKGVGTPSDFPAEAGTRGVGRCGTRSEARDGGRPTPSSFRRKQESRGSGGSGAHPDTNPFPRRHRPRYPLTLSPCTPAPTIKSARPQRRCALTTPGCFPIYTLRLQIPVVSSSAQKTRNETNPTSGGDGNGGAPVVPGEAGIQRCVEEAGHTLTPTPCPQDTVPATLPSCTAAPTIMGARPKAMRPHNPRLFSYLHPRLQIPVVSSPCKKLETKRIQPAERLGVEGAPPHHSLEGMDVSGMVGDALPERIAQRCGRGRLPRRRLESPLVPIARRLRQPEERDLQQAGVARDSETARVVH